MKQVIPPSELTYSPKPVEWPDRLSTLLEWAIIDIKACVDSGFYTFEGSSWVSSFNNTCYICLAGAVLTQRCEAWYFADVPIIGQDPGKYMDALDSLRRGDIFEAWNAFYDSCNPSLEIFHIPIRASSNDLDALLPILDEILAYIKDAEVKAFPTPKQHPIYESIA